MLEVLVGSSFVVTTSNATWVCTEEEDRWRIAMVSNRNKLNFNNQEQRPEKEGTLFLNGKSARTRVFQFINSLDEGMV